jgi:hypothetical protein
MGIETGTALGIASIGTTALGAVTGAVGSSAEGAAVQAQSRYQAAVARNNKILSERAARDAIARGEIAETVSRSQTAQLIGAQRAQQAAQGIEVDTGSALDVITDTAGLGELDALTIRSNAEREAADFLAQGSNFEASARLAEARGQTAGTAAGIGSVGTLLTGATSVAEKWFAFKQQGAF